MTNFGNELFLLMANLSQYKNRQTVLRIFVEALNELYPHLELSYSEKINNQKLWKEEICTADYQFGYLHASNEPREEELAQIQNATQMVGVILQNIKQQELLSNEKLQIKQQVDKRTSELKEKNEHLKKSNELIVQKEQHFRLLVDNAPDAIFIQTNWKFQYINKKALELFGATNSEQLIGEPILNRFPSEFHEQIKRRIKGLNEKKEKQNQTELICIKLDGTKTDIETSGIPFTYNNQKGALVFARDITERKKVEKALYESNKRLESFLLISQRISASAYD